MNEKFKDVFKYIGGMPKTIYFNLKMFGPREALKFPVVLSPNVVLYDISGEIEVKNPRPFGIRIGFNHSDIYSWRSEKTIIKNSGKIIFEGRSKIGYGSSISNDGTLVMGDGFSISARGKILCRKSIKLGTMTMMAWDTLIMDTDHHPIFQNNKRINEDAEITIGSHNWIGAKSTILKGVKMGDENIIALGSLVTKSFEGNNKLIGGTPAKILKENIEWK